MRILGLDTSLTGTGLARIDIEPAPPIPGVTDDMVGTAISIAVATVSAPKPTKDKSKRAMVLRVERLLEQIEGCFEGDDKPDHVGIEGLAYGAKGEGAWVLPWIWGETLRLCVKYEVPITVVATSARAKFATGKGNAPKDQVLLAAAKLFPGVDIKDNNEADAAIIAAVVCQQLGMPIVTVTNYRIDVMQKLGD